MQEELLFFCRAFWSGVCLAAGYELLLVFRNLVSHRSFLIGMEDIVYWCCVALYLFRMIYQGNDGVIRSYVLLSVCLGAFVFHIGPGRVLAEFLTRIFREIFRFLRLAAKPLGKWRKRLKFLWDRVMNKRLCRKSGNGKMKKRKKRNSQNKIAMLSITFVVAVLFIAMMTKSLKLQQQISDYRTEIKAVESQMEEEKERTKEIDEIKERMDTDEYVAEVAREKLGLVKDNEIVFKEEEK